MSVEVEDIRAWVDGELNEHRAREVSHKVSSDEVLQRIANSMRASQLPYEEAYSQTPVIDVPDSLQIKVAALQDSAGDVGNVGDVGDVGKSIENDPEENALLKGFSIAASVMLAAMVGYLAGYDLNKEVVTPDVLLAEKSTFQSDQFARSIAAYQAFYTRDTLIGTDNSPAVVAALTERLVAQTGMEVKIPELDGYEFVRAQHLSYNDQPLLQLVYLGAEGGPLALCYMLASAASAEVSTRDELNEEQMGQDEAVTTLVQKHHGLNTAEWIHKGHRFVIVSDNSVQKLEELSLSTRKQWEI